MKRFFLCAACVSILVLLASTPAYSQSYREIEVKNGGTIQGTVKLKGAPRIEPLKVQQDTAHCGMQKVFPALVIGKHNGVQNAIVSLNGITQGKKFSQQALIMDQNKCDYVPHILLAPLGAKIQIVNSDPILHNVHAYNLADPDPQGRPNTAFNIALPIAGMKREVAVDKAGSMLALCDAGHPWMSAFIVAMGHPYYAVTDADGTFRIDQVPPGTYHVKMWHEPVPKITGGKPDFMSGKPYEMVREISVSAGATATVDFEFSVD